VSPPGLSAPFLPSVAWISNHKTILVNRALKIKNKNAANIKTGLALPEFQLSQVPSAMKNTKTEKRAPRAFIRGYRSAETRGLVLQLVPASFSGD